MQPEDNIKDRLTAEEATDQIMADIDVITQMMKTGWMEPPEPKRQCDGIDPPLS